MKRPNKKLELSPASESAIRGCSRLRRGQLNSTFGGRESDVPDNQFRRDASGRLTFEMFRVAAADYSSVSRAVATALGLTMEPATFLAGLDLLSMHFRRGEHAVDLAWDNWTGFMVIAAAPDAEPLVREVGAWLLQSPWAKEGGAVSGPTTAGGR
jgi:hypothetical protein